MEALSKECDIHRIEKRWQKRWVEMGVYHFNWADTERPTYSINTPPPYPSGDFHMGNVLNWTYFDVMARFKRMRGFNVYFPQGWDCHGLPTEVEAEEHYGIRKTEVSPDRFRKLCEKLVDKYIGKMKEAITRLGCSIDWKTEYKTMDSDYWRRTQLSFLLLNQKGLIYKGTHPINWCPRCETAIADAEVEHEEIEGTIYYIKFKLERENGGSITIATTRPELLPACVTVGIHPRDDRYKDYVEKEVIVPVFGRRVKIVTDDMVDPDYGTGVVMICTYGDKADVKFVAKHRLPVIICIDGDGKMNRNAGEYYKLTVEEARRSVVRDVKRRGLLERTERIQREVGVCWRCKTPIEILEREQWFMKTRHLADEVVESASEVIWYPDHMKTRLIDWTKSLDWDWVISRQRVFATPIPAWYCEKCGEILLAEPEWLPIDPKSSEPKIECCPSCGSKHFVPERDVLDTWFDSSLTCAVHAGWPDREDWRRLFPADLHPSGADIIRTWAYYLMVRHLALFGERPYRSCLINGMVLGSDGRKMSKSLGNYTATLDVFQRYGADATRQWATGGGATGSDIPFRWPDVEYGRRFLIKLWNAARFVSLQMKDYIPQSDVELGVIDRWLLSRLEKMTKRVTDALESCQFSVAIEEVRGFTWRVLCDRYIEAIKHRLYNPETYDKERVAAQYVLYEAIYRVLQLLAPISPHVIEEIYQSLYAKDKKYESIHVSSWPSTNKDRIDDEAEICGDLVIALIGEVRRDKADRRIPLNTPIKKLTIYADDKRHVDVLNQAVDDVAGTCKAESVEVTPRTEKGREVEGYPKLRFVANY
jgi:valyl-tRNA synthetase